MRTKSWCCLSVLILFCILKGEGLRFYGDILLSRGIAKFSENNGPSEIKSALLPFLNKDALHIANLEGVVGDSCDCQKTSNPCFFTPVKMLDLLQGFKVISLENNHVLDLGLRAPRLTVTELKKRHIVPLQGANNSALIQTENGNIGIVSFTNVLNPKNDKSQVAWADSPKALQEIKRLKNISTLVAVYVHWGKELIPAPTEQMKTLAQKYIEAGADIVVGTHSHVIGSVEIIQGKPVIYSLGNFLFDQKYAYTKKGAVFDCVVSENGRLNYSLIGHETPMNSFIPSISKQDDFTAENKLLAACSLPSERVWTGVFTTDKKKKKLVLKPHGVGDSLWRMELYDLFTNKLEIKTPAMPIRKLIPVDFNQDGIQEIFLIQSIYSNFDKERAKRVFVYSMKVKFHALWRGTALSRPLIDATIALVKSEKPLLVALHSADSYLLRNPNCKERLVMAYHWNGFGFKGIKEVQVEDSSDELTFRTGFVKIVKNKNQVGELPLSNVRMK